MNKILFLLFFVINFSYSQSNYEYFGVLKLNGKSESIISYRIVFKEVKGKLEGFSVTDLGGNHETKNKISGSYNEATKSINFREENILYTKSPLSNDIFCFVNFTGKIKLTKENKSLEGTFKGLFKDNSKCIDGTLEMAGLAKIENQFKKLNAKIQKSNRIDQATKVKANPLTLLDSLKVNTLSRDQNLSVFIASNTINIEIWDGKIEDGDRINLIHNGKRIVDNYSVVNKKKVIKVTLSEDINIFRIEAINEGNRKLNTAMIRIIDNDRTFELSTNLKAGEKASISIVKN